MEQPEHASLLHALQKDYFLWCLIGLLALLTVTGHGRITGYVDLVDWSTVAALTGLLILTKGVEISGYLHHLGKRLALSMSTERALALSLVIAAALLSTVLTNDVTLFVVVPLTLGLRAIGKIPVTRLVVFEALAVNAGSTLTPIGNPQNLFLWQLSGISFYRFTAAMAPLTAILVALLLLLTAWAFRGHRLVVGNGPEPILLDKKLLCLSLALYLPFLKLVDMRQGEIAVILLLFIFFIAYRHVLRRVDWPLIVVFVLMFVDVRLIAEIPLLRGMMTQAVLDDPRHFFFAGVLSSQLISNVPTAILLAEYSANWKLIAHAVNIGGFGFILGSLANIIALRMVRDSKSWLVFHAFSVPMLCMAAISAYLLVFM
ncbi:MAG TPA: SLC13 family permease [Nitrosospira sp.]|nr:SLC13 family permease [Nitrosospira sp.]